MLFNKTSFGYKFSKAGSLKMYLFTNDGRKRIHKKGDSLERIGE